jgi:hypothetical protein
MAYEYDLDEELRPLSGYWLPNKGAVLIKTRASGVYRRKVEPAGLVTFIEAAALLRRYGKPVTRVAVYQWAKAGKFRYSTVKQRPDVRPVAVIRLTELRRFAERNGFECLPLSSVPPSER